MGQGKDSDMFSESLKKEEALWPKVEEVRAQLNRFSSASALKIAGPCFDQMQQFLGFAHFWLNARLLVSEFDAADYSVLLRQSLPYHLLNLKDYLLKLIDLLDFHEHEEIAFTSENELQLCFLKALFDPSLSLKLEAIIKDILEVWTAQNWKKLKNYEGLRQALSNKFFELLRFLKNTTNELSLEESMYFLAQPEEQVMMHRRSSLFNRLRAGAFLIQERLQGLFNEGISGL